MRKLTLLFLGILISLSSFCQQQLPINIISLRWVTRASDTTDIKAAPHDGLMFYNPVYKKLRIYDGAAWKTVGGSSGGGGLSIWGGITGTLSDQTDLITALNAKVPTSRTINSQALTSDITLTKSNIGLSNVDNTSDASKPVSTLQAAADALNLKIANNLSDGNASTMRTNLGLGTAAQISSTAGGDLTGTLPSPTLVTSGITAATYGSATQVPQITFDAKGRGTSASNVTVTPAISSVTGLGTGVGTAASINQGSAGALMTNSNAETISAIKTFTASPIVPDPTTATQAANKEYTDAAVGVTTPIGSIFTESWANLSQWSNVGTPGASVTSNQLSFSGTASTSTNYIQCSGYGKTNFENMVMTWTETVGTIGASSTGIAFALQSNSTLGSVYQNHIMVNVDLSSGASKGKIVWYANGVIKQTSSNLTVPIAGNVLNCKLIMYPDKYYFEYNINGGAPIGDTWLINTGIGYTSVLNNASEFAFFNIGGGSSHTVGAFAATCFQGKGADLLLIGNSILSGYSNNYFYNRAVTQIQKRAKAIIEVYARPSNSVNDLNINEITLYNAKKLFLLPCSNDLIVSGAATATADLATFVTALASITTPNAPSGYSVAQGNLAFGTEMPRVGSASIATYNTSLISTYGLANIVNFYGVASKNSTSMATDYSYDGVHPNDVLNSIMADMIIQFYGYARKTTYTNNEFFTYSPPAALNTNIGPEVYITNSSNFKSICFNCFVTAGSFKSRDLTNSAVIGDDNTNGLGFYVNNGNTLGSVVTISKRLGIDNAGAISTGSTSSVTYRTTNAGSDVLGHLVIDPVSSVTSGIGYVYGTAAGFGATQGNGTRRILGAYIKPGNLTATSGSEAMGWDFGTQTAGAAATTTMSLSPSGVLSVPAGLAGVTNAGSAASGIVGEPITNLVSTYTNFTTTATYQNIGSITLTAGSWDITATVTLSDNSATLTTTSDAIFTIATTTASATGAVEGETIAYIDQGGLSAGSHKTVSFIPKRVDISGSTTYYLNGQATFTIGNPQYVGKIRAVRVR